LHVLVSLFIYEFFHIVEFNATTINSSHMCVYLGLCQTTIYTLFPYTTLFRSSWRRRPMRSSPTPSTSTASPPTSSSSPWSPTARDRKSTRLNSSHVKISYAVFCLKKKIIPNENFYEKFNLFFLVL